VSAEPYLLLVEDNQDDLDLTLLALGRSQVAAEVEVVRNGADALDYLLYRGAYADRRLRLPAAVFLDLNLPKLSGTEVLARLRAEEATRRLPVVILSTSGYDADILACYRLGANSYVRKPISFEVFTRTIEALGRYWLGRNVPMP
jgi:two-component system, response regulator